MPIPNKITQVTAIKTHLPLGDLKSVENLRFPQPLSTPNMCLNLSQDSLFIDQGRHQAPLAEHLQEVYLSGKSSKKNDPNSQ